MPPLPLSLHVVWRCVTWAGWAVPVPTRAEALALTQEGEPGPRCS